jgi:4-amino-4-deoxy-L-arabinose transferase-like glycosyltransferase
MATTVAAPRETASGQVLNEEVSRVERRHDALYVSLFLVGFALRFGFVLWKRTYHMAPGNVLPFGAEIASIAERIAEGRGFSSPFYIETGPTAWISPLYPYLNALAFELFGVFSTASAIALLLLQCLMAGGTGVAIYALGVRCFGEKVALWSAWIWAVSPFFYRWPVSWIWDFTATALLVTIALIVTLDTAEKGTRRWWLGLGGIWGLIALTNPAPLSIMPFSLGYAAFENRRAGKRWLLQAVMACLVFGAMITPWLVRNYVVFGQPIFLRSNYWFEFHMGNYHLSNGVGYSGTHPNVNVRVLAQYKRLGEPAFIEHYKHDAFQFVKKYPGEFLQLTLQRALWFWNGYSLVFYGNVEWWSPWEFWPLSAMGLLGLLFALTRRPPGWFLFLAALMIYPIPYYLAYPSVKYRHAIEPLLLLLSAFLISVLWKEIAVHRSLKLSTRTTS